MNIEIDCSWKNDMAFEASSGPYKIMMDADESVGGTGMGARPKPLLLSALAGCTGMDVVAILKKMQVEFDSFSINVNGELTEEHPRIFDRINIIYQFTGKDLPLDKINKAVQLSQEKYCGISAMLAKAAEITYEIELNS
ncbi:MAG: OsmC family protein [Bacteroidota bacterium]